MLNWEKVTKFKPSEFAEDPSEYSNPKTIYDLNTFRLLLGRSIEPSKASGAVARIDGNTKTRHYAVGRKSDALDIFPKCSPEYTYQTLLSSRLFNGIGVYFDTNNNYGKSATMFHIDQRPLKDSGLPTIWYRDEGKYVYPGQDPEGFYIDLINRLANRIT